MGYKDIRQLDFSKTDDIMGFSGEMPLSDLDTDNEHYEDVMKLANQMEGRSEQVEKQIKHDRIYVRNRLPYVQIKRFNQCYENYGDVYGRDKKYSLTRVKRLSDKMKFTVKKVNKADLTLDEVRALQ